MTVLNEFITDYTQRDSSAYHKLRIASSRKSGVFIQTLCNHIFILEKAMVQYFSECENGKVATMLAPQDRLRQLVRIEIGKYVQDADTAPNPLLFGVDLLEHLNAEKPIIPAPLKPIQSPPRTCPQCDAPVYDRKDFDTPTFAKYTCNSEVTVDPLSSGRKFETGDKCKPKFATTMPPDKQPELQCPNCHRGISDSPLRYSCGTAIYAPVASQTLECKAWQERLINTPSNVSKQTCRTDFMFVEGENPTASRIVVAAVSEDSARHKATVSLMAGRNAEAVHDVGAAGVRATSYQNRDEATKLYKSIRESLILVTDKHSNG